MSLYEGSLKRMRGEGGNLVKKNYVKIALSLVVSSLFFLCAAKVQAVEKSVVEEILDILLANRQISQKQYQYLLNKARAEERTRAERSAKKTDNQTQHPEKPTEVTAVESKKSTGTKINTYWKNGLRFETPEKDFSITLGGKIHYDWGYINEDEDVGRLVGEDFGSGSKIRRARLIVKGTLYKDIDFKAEYGFSGGDVEVKDLYLGMKNLPYLGSFKVGHTKEPFSLEELTTGSEVTFMERSLPNALVPGRNIGFVINNSLFDRKLGCSVGAFSETDDKRNGFGENDRYNLTFRVTSLPWYQGDGSKLLLFGTSYSHKFMDRGTPVRYRARPESHLTGARFADTGYIPTDQIDLTGVETALVWNSLSLQSEYIHSFLNREQGSTLDFDGFYIYGSYFLTGEHRPYNTYKECFGRVKPRVNFNLRGEGWGAWEIGLRYSYLDLDDEQVNGGILNEYTAGLNWYLNPITRIMFNYIHSHLNNVGDTNILQSRFQLDF